MSIISYKKTVKRIGDLIAAICLAICLAIPFAFIYAILYISGTRNPIFKQDRPGEKERIFYILKFKTMTDERDENNILLPDEQRMTKIGTFLRKSSLDEIPQIFNVLKGDMSFVGPRPLRTRYLPYYTKEESLRHQVKPGITGLAQISGRNAISWEEKFAFDVEYVKNMSFTLDMIILSKTFFKLFKSNEINLIPEDSSFDEYRLRQSLNTKPNDNSILNKINKN